MGESRFYSFFERVNDVYFLTGCQEHERDLAVLEHIQNFVKHYLLCLLDVKVNVFKDEKKAHLAVHLLEVLLHLLDHLNRIVLLHLREIEGLAELLQNLTLRVVKN